MSLEELGNLGEFVGSIGVLVSLVYLAIQIKKNTDTERTSTYRSIVSDFSRVNQILAVDPALNLLYARALEDFDGLEPSQKAQVAQLFYVTFRNFENMYYQNRKGYLEHEVWIGWKRLMLTYYARPGLQAWWRLRGDLFSEPFAGFLASEKPDRPVRSYAEVAGLDRGAASTATESLEIAP